MSRIGKKPIPVPSGVQITVNPTAAGAHVLVKGPKGTLERTLHPLMNIEVTAEQVSVQRPDDENFSRSLHGLSRTLIANMVEGVTKGYEKRLEVQGVGYRAQAQGQKLELHAGFSHPIAFPVPKGILISIDQEKKNIIIVQGINKELVGETAAKIRAVRPPEPYKGKGIRYLGEQVRRKAGKAAAAAGAAKAA